MESSIPVTLKPYFLNHPLICIFRRSEERNLRDTLYPVGMRWIPVCVWDVDGEIQKTPSHNGVFCINQVVNSR